MPSWETRLRGAATIDPPPELGATDLSSITLQESYLLQDCSAAIQNLLLAASMLGLGGVWIGVHPHSGKMDHVRGLYDLPPHVIPIAAVSLGRPAESPEPRTRYRDEAVHQESFEIRKS